MGSKEFNLDFETLISDFQELLNGSGLTARVSILADVLNRFFPVSSTVVPAVGRAAESTSQP